MRGVEIFFCFWNCIFRLYHIGIESGVFSPLLRILSGPCRIGAAAKRMKMNNKKVLTLLLFDGSSKWRADYSENSKTGNEYS